MFKVNTIVLSICSAFAVVGCASLGELPDKVAHSLGRPESRRADMSAEQFSEFKGAIELRPGEAYLHNNLGYVLLLEGLNQEAVSPLEIALQLEPGNEKAAFNLQLAHARLGSSLRTRQEKTADTTHSAERTEAPVAPEPKMSDPRLVAVAPNIYELKLPEQTLPEIAPLQHAAIQEDLLRPEPVRNARPFRLEVSNGNGTRGMARQVARLLDRNGIHANRITNHTTFRQTTTQIQYRQGYMAEAVALRDVLPAQMKPVPASALRNDIQVRVLLGKDVVSIVRTPLQAYAAADAAHSTPATAVK
jgi:LytR cell envelope-related transcriptional attenuator